MTFQEYLAKTKDIASEEVEILDEMSDKEEWTKIEIRAVKNSMQVLIENSIGKAKRILKYFNCPIVPQKGSDAFEFMYDMGLIEDDVYSTMENAIGLRNAMIHDYMNFNNDILKKVKNNMVFWINARRQHCGRDFAGTVPKLLGVLKHRNRVHINHAKQTFKIVLQANPIAYRAQIIAQMQVARGLNARKNTSHEISPFRVDRMVKSKLKRL